MNKSELLDAAAENAGLSKSDMDSALNGLIDAIQNAVKSGDKVSITGFGTFERRERAARTGRNPQTGAEVQIAASKSPAFKPGKKFKDHVNV